ncbi:DNA polymerase, partial [Pseudoalteromonas sp. SIMBA_162]|uniref:DNA polymerase n=1 Tax=Pseudoalteromonas sp. SIMBA_162 TaxID=3080867 RepID=UPI00397B7AF1
LKKLSSQSKPLQLLLKFRDLNKLYSTYIHPMPEMVQKDGRLHGQFLQVQTATGRFASQKPNLQNLPYLARKMIIPAENHVIIGVDYSQIEPRVLAHFTGDDSMIDAYVNNRDLYIEMAMKVFKLERKYCEDKAY